MTLPFPTGATFCAVQGLSLFMAITGSFTAIQFVETLIRKESGAGQHTSKKGSALFSVFAAAWCIGVNCVWVMHFLAMSAGECGSVRVYVCVRDRARCGVPA